MDGLERIRDVVAHVPPPPEGDGSATFDLARRRARRRRRAAVGAASLTTVVAVIALASTLRSPGTDRVPVIADVPEHTSDPAEFELGIDYVWQTTGSFEEAGQAFAEQVLGWDDVQIVEQHPPLEGSSNPAFILLEGSEERRVELYLEPADDGDHKFWNVVQVSAGIEQPLSLTETADLYWRPLDDHPRYGTFEGSSGTAYVRTLNEGTLAIPLDQEAVRAAEVPLEGWIEFSADPICHAIQSALLLFTNGEGSATAAIGGVWYGGDSPDCRRRDDVADQPVE